MEYLVYQILVPAVNEQLLLLQQYQIWFIKFQFIIIRHGVHEQFQFNQLLLFHKATAIPQTYCYSTNVGST